MHETRRHIPKLCAGHGLGVWAPPRAPAQELGLGPMPMGLAHSYLNPELQLIDRPFPQPQVRISLGMGANPIEYTFSICPALLQTLLPLAFSAPLRHLACFIGDRCCCSTWQVLSGTPQYKFEWVISLIP